jgi:hypothetical protein
MPKQLPRQCPACNTNLVISRLTCPECGTEVTGMFSPDLFSRLSTTDFDFVVLFLKAKGNIKEMERELGISYWTIRSKLSEIVEALGLESVEAQPEDRSIRRQAILDRLNAGEITVQEAAAFLEELKLGLERGR